MTRAPRLLAIAALVGIGGLLAAPARAGACYASPAEIGPPSAAQLQQGASFDLCDGTSISVISANAAPKAGAGEPPAPPPAPPRPEQYPGIARAAARSALGLAPD